jgi:hypothetical protein
MMPAAGAPEQMQVLRNATTAGVTVLTSLTDEDLVRLG